MEALTGRITKLMGKRTGQKRDGSGTWRALDVLVTVNGNPLYITAWGDKADALANVNEGTEIEFDVFIKSREYNGRWYTELSFSKLQIASLFNDEPAPKYPDEPEEREDNDTPF